jgi:hypothetical protein
MNILCKIFGHSPPVYAKKGWFSPGEEYAQAAPGYRATDGIGRVHVIIEGECARCGKRFHLARLHLPKEMQ